MQLAKLVLPNMGIYVLSSNRSAIPIDFGFEIVNFAWISILPWGKLKKCYYPSEVTRAIIISVICPL